MALARHPYAPRTIPPTTTLTGHVHRRITGGTGCKLKRPRGRRSLEPTIPDFPHKYPRTDYSLPSPAILQVPQRTPYKSPQRQHYGGSLHKQRRLSKVIPTKQLDNVPSSIVPGLRSPYLSVSHSRSEECDCRRIVTQHSPPIRMEPRHKVFPLDTIPGNQSPSRPVCYERTANCSNLSHQSDILRLWP